MRCSGCKPREEEELWNRTIGVSFLFHTGIVRILYLFFFQTLFTRALSRRIRHIRHVTKKKSQPDSSALAERGSEEDVGSEACQEGSSKKRKIASHSNLSSPAKSRATVPQEEYRKHLSELSSEMCKAKPNEKHIQALLDAIHKNNQQWFSTLDDGELAPIMKVLPCYEFGTHVSYTIYAREYMCIQWNSEPGVSFYQSTE